MVLLVLAAVMVDHPTPRIAPSPHHTQVMVLGSWHFNNPGADLLNLKAEDVLTDRRQAELEAVAEGLAAFRPTKIMVERVAKVSGLVDPRFGEFTPADLRKNRDERVQIAYRLASRLGLRQVYAIDEQPSDGEPDYFPIGKVIDYAKEHGGEAKFAQLMGRAQESVKRLEAKQATSTMGELLADMNDPNGFYGRIGDYYEFLKFGDADQQPGADLNAMWYLRNAKIFGKATTVAKADDRIVILFGAGHTYWLRHFAASTPGYRNVDPRPYLRRRVRQK